MSATPHLVPVPDAEPVQPLFHVGDVVSSVAQLKALPEFTVVLGDPAGVNPQKRYRRVSLQKRADDDATPWWYPAWDSDIFNALAADEAVNRFDLGPFQILWLPAPAAAA